MWLPPYITVLEADGSNEMSEADGSNEMYKATAGPDANGHSEWVTFPKAGRATCVG